MEESCQYYTKEVHQTISPDHWVAALPRAGWGWVGGRVGEGRAYFFIYSVSVPFPAPNMWNINWHLVAVWETL